MYRRHGLRAAALIAAIGVFLLLPALVAAGVPTLSVYKVSFTEKVATFASAYETGTASVALLVDSTEVTRTAVPTGVVGTALLQTSLPSSCTVEAAAFSESGELLGTSAPLPFHGSSYAPSSVTLALRQSQIVAPTYAFKISGSSNVTAARLYVNGRLVFTRPVTLVNGSALLPSVPIRYGRSTVQLVGANAWGAKTSITFVVYQIGKYLPPYWHYVLVDKSDFYLYYVEGSRLIARYPVAIGMPWAPTPTGLFRLWYPQPASGVWGVIRMQLQRRITGGFVPTSYYIHGTNDPSSIGTMASHGCVRMYNRDVLNLASRLKKYSKRPWTVIRN